MEKAVPEVKQDVPVMARFLSDELTDRERKKMEKERPKKRKPLPPFLKVILFLSLLTVFAVAAFAAVGYINKLKQPEEAGSAVTEADETEELVSDNELKAEGTVVIIDMDLKGKKLRFRDPVSAEEYVLSFETSTVYEDAYGNPMVVKQLKTGDIVDILVSVHSSVLSSVKRNSSNEYFSISGITDYDISEKRGIISCEGRNYRLLKGTVLLSDEGLSSFRSIKDGDVLSISGIGQDVYTIERSGGNGYVRIVGAESFEGGWIELGDNIRPIEDGMVLTVPEGSYSLSVTYRHYGGSKDVSVTRGRETLVDVSDLKGDLLKTGQITFSFEPADANPAVYIDGKLVVKESALELDYGVHTLDVKAEGYEDIHKYLKVGQPMANLAIVLEEEEKNTPSSNSSDRNTGKKADTEKETDKDSKSDPIPKEALPEVFKNKDKDKDTDTGASSGADEGSGEGSQDNTEKAAEEGVAEDDTETVTTDVSQLYIDGPEGAEVYYDGAYKGIAPCHFKKNGGTHVITLMKNGYETKSYTLNLASGTENEAYSFNELSEATSD